MIQVLKRNGDIDEFEKENIWVAVHSASNDSLLGADEDLATEIADLAEQWAKEEHLISSQPLTVEQIQDKVEMLLMESERKDVAKSYILYREQKNKERLVKPKQVGLLSEEFLSQYKHKEPPMTELGKFVYYRTYSRWLPQIGRREAFFETVQRAVEYNCSLLPTTKEEAEEIFDNIFNLRQFPSGRSLWVALSGVEDVAPSSNFNCSFQVIDKFEDFEDLFYLLLVGSGVGQRIYPSDVDKLPEVRTDIDLIHKSFEPVQKSQRLEHTNLKFSKDKTTVIIEVGDSKAAWKEALGYYFRIHWDKTFSDINRIIMNYDNIRLAGEPLKTFGGYSSGYLSLKEMFVKLNRVISLKEELLFKLRPIDVLDISNIIAENVKVGGIRRSSEIMLIDKDDKESVFAKAEINKKVNGKEVFNKDLAHRYMSNNTIMYREKPSYPELKEHFRIMRENGEPGIANFVEMQRRNPFVNGTNPCFEILLDSKQNCNLSTVNAMAFVKDGQLDEKGLLNAQRLSARIGYRMTNVELELPEWNYKLHRDRLTGCSLTGWQDMKNAIGLTNDEEAALLRKLKKAAKDAIKEIAEENNMNESLLVTCVKPEGTLSQLPTVSSGVHYNHSEYYIRRVRISYSDPLAQLAIKSGFPVNPENGETWDNCKTIIIEFPVKAPNGKTKNDVSAIEQLETYKRFMDNYVDHNCSITISVKNDEWDGVVDWVYENWDSIVGVSFVPLKDAAYKQMPYEEITKEKYEKRIAELPKFSPNMLIQFEKQRYDHDVYDDECSTGACPVR